MKGGRIYQQRFERGVPCTPLAVAGECEIEEHGTTVTWLADASIFTSALREDGSTSYDVEHLRGRIRELAYLNPSLSLSFHDAHGGKVPEIFHYKHGIADYISEWNAAEALHSEVFAISGKEKKIKVEVALQYNKGDQETVLCYANNLPCRLGGSHYTGFKTALTRTLNRYARKNGFLKDQDRNFSGDDLRHGLTVVVSVYLPHPIWVGATRDRIVNPEVAGIVSRATSRALSRLLTANPETARAILTKAEQAR